MQESEIYELARSVISTITRDVNDGLYSSLDGSLSVSWGTTENVFQASATPESKVNEPPVHKITISYALVLRLYRDLEEYYDYIANKSDQQKFDQLFQNDPYYTQLLPMNIEPEHCIKNMFIGAITWVFFHELAHLLQEHVYVLNQSTNTSQYLAYDEFNTENSITLEGKLAAIHHTLEFAADFQAIRTCISELFRHFSSNELDDSIGIFVCAISCAIYRLHDPEKLNFYSEIKGSHPPPIVRLEHILPQIWEILDLLSKAEAIKLNRSELVHLCDRSATTACFFWFKKKSLESDSLKSFIHCGTINRPGGKEYMRKIINTWDEIEPEISKNKRLDDPLALIRFTEQYRNIVFENSDS